jgi:aspartyl/glutamyl-tRNA(Asn/Gln) amidotransferase C subunit
MPITDEQLRALATLAQLELGGDAASLRQDLERILAYVDRLKDFDDPNIEPLLHPNLGAGGIDVSELRGDPIDAAGNPEGLSRATLEDFAPRWREGRFEVPRTVEHEP